jgi:DNA-directed RNA polymerase beta' subunit
MSLEIEPVSRVVGVSLKFAENDNQAVVQIHAGTIAGAVTGVATQESVYHVNSPLLGSQDTWTACMTCEKTRMCPGHFGKIALGDNKIYNPHLMQNRVISKILGLFCFQCGTPYEIKAATGTLKKCRQCEIEVSKIEYSKTKYDFIADYKDSQKQSKKGVFLNRAMVYRAFQRIPKNKLQLYTKNIPQASLMYDFVFVSPQFLRLAMNTGNVQKASQLTLNYNSIVRTALSGETAAAPDKKLTPAQLIQSKLHECIFGAKTVSGARTIDSQGYMKDLGNKYSIFRRNLFAFRTSDGGRAVISCAGGDCAINELQIPVAMARKLYKEIRVTHNNINECMTYFNNCTNYPGFILLKKASGRNYRADRIKIADTKLEVGDIICRHLIDGDAVTKNRNPTLLTTNIATFNIKVKEGITTIAFDAIACILQNADFDGDALNIINVKSNIGDIEMRVNTGFPNAIVSQQNGTPNLGAFQDTIVGSALLTHSKTRISRTQALKLLGDTGDYNVLAKIDMRKSEYTGRELFSLLLPDGFNYQRKSDYVNALFKKYDIIKYYDGDEVVKITNGKLLSGVLDKKTLGQGSKGSIIHVINNEYGAKEAMQLMQNIKMVIIGFLNLYGLTITPEDVNIGAEGYEMIDQITRSNLAAYKANRQLLYENRIIPPPGQTIMQRYEEMQLNALVIGDNAIVVALKYMGKSTKQGNGLIVTSVSGSKGSLKNMSEMLVCGGQIYFGSGRIPNDYSSGRPSPYTFNFFDDAEAAGYNTSSYNRGVSTHTHINMSQKIRNDLIQKSQSTADAGAASRENGKNLEGQHSDYFYRVVKGTHTKYRVVQILYAYSGLDIKNRLVVSYDISTTTDSAIKKMFETEPIAAFGKEVAELAAQQAAELKTAKYDFILGQMNYERANHEKSRFSKNIAMIYDIDSIVHKLRNKYNNLGTINSTFNFDEYRTLIKKFREELPYIFFNSRTIGNMEVPVWYKDTVKLAWNYTLMHMSLGGLLRHKLFDTDLIRIAFEQMIYIYKTNLIQPGTNTGLISAMCIGEIATQWALDSQHRAGGDISALDKQKGIVKNSGNNTGKTTHKKVTAKSLAAESARPKYGLMINLLPQYAAQKDVAQRILNNLQEIQFRELVADWQLFYEPNNEIVHPQFTGESSRVKEMSSKLASIAGANLTFWTVRVEIHKNIMYYKQFTLMEVHSILVRKFPRHLITYSSINDKTTWIRFRLSTQDPSLLGVSALDTNTITAYIEKTLLGCILRGIRGVKVARLLETTSRTFIDADGVPGSRTEYAIDTLGAEFDALYDIPEVDINASYTTDVIMMEKMFGIAACRNRIVYEMRSNGGEGLIDHYYSFADEMTFAGMYTTLGISGMVKRDPDTRLTAMGYQHPTKHIFDMASQGISSDVTSMTSCAIVGTTPRLGTKFSQIAIDFDKMNKHSDAVSIGEIFEEQF